ncbi:hypothetical protein Lysil_2326 [Lysobacter silvestris]|uniref:Uncharacterized protein n=2 Tax=Solilutibacter silvestris TaxID=1645665 RepID=A0A2K1PZE8_9GAMM|nr:hypothetical protein Lysil_2326 [Lysobacter silvestris]
MAQNRINYELGVSVLHSDNIGLIPDHPQDDWVIAPTLTFDVRRDSSNLRLTAHGIAQYLDYAQGSFPNSARGALAAQANWVISPGRLEFMAADHLTRRPADSLVSYNPANAQQINVFVAGPTWVASLSPTTRSRFDLRVSDSVAAKTHEIDGQQYLLSGAIDHDLAPNRSISGAVTTEQVRFSKLSKSDDYDRESIFARYDTRMRTILLQTDLGWSRVNIQKQNVSASGPLVRIDVAWIPSSSQALHLRLSQQYADTTEDVVAHSLDERYVLIQDFLNAEGVVTPQVYRDRRALMFYDYRSARLTFKADIESDRATPLQPGGEGWRALLGSLSGSYRLTPSWTFNAYAAAFRRTLTQQIGNDRNQFIGAGFGYRWNTHWNARIDLQHRTRNTPVHTQNFKENGIVFYIGYQP